MFVRLLIGSNAGAIVEMPYDVATSNLSSGIVAEATEKEIAEAGYARPLVQSVAPDELVKGYAIVDNELNGFDVIDAGGVRINAVDKPFHNHIAARHAAMQHSADARGVTIDTTALTKVDNRHLDETKKAEAALEKFNAEQEAEATKQAEARQKAIEDAQRQADANAKKLAAEARAREEAAAARQAQADADAEKVRADALKRAEQAESGGEATSVEIPENWRDLHHMTRAKLARQIAGTDDTYSADEADAVIEAELKKRSA